jgi:FkbM family methyltransferase
VDHVQALGRLARFARGLGLGAALESVRDRSDVMWIRLGRLPLHGRAGDLDLRGLLRHRSYLDSLAHGYECCSRELFLEALRPGTLVVDGGAHIGLYSLTALRTEPGLAGVIAFEPDPFNFAALRLNVPARQRPLVRVENKAIGEHPGVARFPVSSGTISSSLYDRPDVSGPWIQTHVEIAALDQELSGIAYERLLVKLDLEGAEPPAFCGLAGTLAVAPDVVVIAEANAAALRRGGYSVNDLFVELESAGLEVFMVDEEARRLVATPNPDTMPKGNVIAARGEFAAHLRCVALT